MALLEPPIQDELGLDAGQRRAIERASRGHARRIEELREALARGEIAPEAYRSRVAALARELDVELSRAVPEDVRHRLRALGGRPFAGAAALRAPAPKRGR